MHRPTTKYIRYFCETALLQFNTEKIPDLESYLKNEIFWCTLNLARLRVFALSSSLTLHVA